jgi:hypothetical protein
MSLAKRGNRLFGARHATPMQSITNRPRFAAKAGIPEHLSFVEREEERRRIVVPRLLCRIGRPDYDPAAIAKRRSLSAGPEGPGALRVLWLAQSSRETE